MKITFVFILFILFISCNQSQQPTEKVFNGLEDTPQSASDSIQKLSTKTAVNKSANAFRESRSLLNVNKGLVGAYLGTNGGKYFKLCLDKVMGDQAEGYVVTGNEKTIVRGKIMKLAVEPVQLGSGIIYRLVLSAFNKTKGEYVITLSVSSKGTSGEGNWMSGNKKLTTEIVIKERVI